MYNFNTFLTMKDVQNKRKKARDLDKEYMHVFILFNKKRVTCDAA